MATPIEEAIAAYASARSEVALRNLDAALVEGRVLVPVSQAVTQIQQDTYDIPVICLRTVSGEGSIPAFTTVEQLLKWKPAGCLYATVTGRSLIRMAIGMPEIASIVINVDGAPRGAVPRSEFDRLVAQI